MHVLCHTYKLEKKKGKKEPDPSKIFKKMKQFKFKLIKNDLFSTEWQRSCWLLICCIFLYIDRGREKKNENHS